MIGKGEKKRRDMKRKIERMVEGIEIERVIRVGEIRLERADKLNKIK